MGFFGLLLRAGFIQVVAWWALIAYGVGLAGIRLRGLGAEARKQEIDRLRGRVLRTAMETLGATFIKLGQVLSTRPDLLPRETIEELRKLQDRLPAFPDAPKLIEKELGRPISECFAELEEAPIAAASVAQVHRGKLLDGTVVAVKLLRPDVRERARRDGAILRQLMRVLEWISPRARHAQLVDHTQHFIEGILEQTDLRVEAANYEQFRANFRRVKKVRFPRVFPELSGERIMTMEFLEGVKVDAIPREKLPHDLPQRLRDAFLKMCFDDGFLHADLHPGNFVVMKDGSIAIFDAGLTKKLSDELLEHYIDFNRCLVMGDVDDLMRHIRKYHSYVEGQVNWAELERDIREFNEGWRGMNARELEFGKLIDKVFAMGRKYGVRPVPDMTLMMVGLITAEGIGKQLDPDVNSFQEVSNYLIPVLARRNMLSPSLMEAAAKLQERMSGEALASEA